MIENDKQTHILVECPELIASVRLGVLAPLAPLEKDGLCEVRFRRTVDIHKRDIEWCDVYVCVRGFERIHVFLSQVVKRSGRTLLYFLDDDLADIPSDIPSANFAILCNARENIQAILRNADALWVVNDHLGKKYSAWCPRVLLSRVPVDLTDIPRNPAPDRKLRVLYAGSLDHTPMIQKQLVPAILRLLDNYPENFSFTFIGADPGITVKDKLSYHPFLDSYDAYKKLVKSGRFHIGLAPIRPESFFGYKYYNKFIEYASDGIVGIYAFQRPYTEVVVDGYNGYLTDCEPEDWYQALLRAWRERDKLTLFADNAIALLQKDFSPRSVSDQLKNQGGDLLLRKTSGVVQWSFPYSLKGMFFIERIHYHFRRNRILAIPILGYRLIRKIGKSLLKWGQSHARRR